MRREGEGCGRCRLSQLSDEESVADRNWNVRWLKFAIMRDNVADDLCPLTGIFSLDCTEYN